MKKKNYLKKFVDVIEFRAEKGFAASADTEAFTDGGNINLDNASNNSDDPINWGF